MAAAVRKGIYKPGRIELASVATMQAELDTFARELAAALGGDLDRTHPAMSLDDIKSNWPDHWVALLPSGLDEHGKPSTWRVIAAAQDRSSLKEQKAEFAARCPGAALLELFAGRYPAGADVVILDAARDHSRGRGFRRLTDGSHRALEWTTASTSGRHRFDTHRS